MLDASPILASVLASQCPQHQMVTRSQNISKSKLSQTVTSITQSLVSHALLAKGEAFTSDPTCYTSAIKFPEWFEAMNKEFDALLKNKAWILVMIDSF